MIPNEVKLTYAFVYQLHDELQAVYNAMLAARAAAIERKRKEQQDLRDEYVRRQKEWQAKKKQEEEERKEQEYQQLQEDIARLESQLGTKKSGPTVWQNT